MAKPPAAKAARYAPPAGAPEFWGDAVKALAKSDPVLRPIIRAHVKTTVRFRDDAFFSLARSIVGQQISVKAAESVWRRLGETVPLEPRALVASAPEVLRGCGLSARKVEYLQGLAAEFAARTFDSARWQAMDDEAVVADLVRLRGIGRWTAEMFLMFHLRRPDILPLDDLGLQKAIALHYNGGDPLDRTALREIATAWQPWRSVAVWYLWRSLDPVPVEY